MAGRDLCVSFAVVLVACGGGGGGGGGAGQDADSSGHEGGGGGPAALVVTDGSGAALAQVAFAPTAVGTQLTQVVHVTNTGGSPTEALSIAATDAADFATDAGTTTCATSLAPGASCNVGLVFHPSASGDRSSTFVITTQSGASLTVVLDGTGVTPDFTVSPAAIALGDIDLGSAGSASITITNNASVSGAIGAPALSGGVADWSVFSHCGTQLAMGASCTIDVVFTPTTLGAPTATLGLALDGSAQSLDLAATGTSELTVIASSGGTITSDPAGIVCGSACVGHFAGPVTLTATGSAGSTFSSWSEPSCTTGTCELAASTTARTVTATFVLETQLYVAPSTLDFGTLAVGSARLATIDVINDSTTTVPLTVASTGSDYAVETGCGSSLAPGAECVAQVTLTPTKLGADPGSLDFIVNGAHHTSTFTAQGGSFLTVAVVGDPTSTVTSTATGLTTCSGVCAALVPGDVTFTAHAGGGATFVGWVPGTCGTSPTCTVTGVPGPQAIRAKFQSAASTPPIHIEPGIGIGPVRTGGLSLFQTFTVVNDSSAVVTLDSIGFNSSPSGPGWAQHVNGSCGATLAPGATCTVIGVFSPSDINVGPGTQFQVKSGSVTYSVTPDAVTGFGLDAGVQGHGRMTGSFGLACPGFCSEVVHSAGDTLTATPDTGFAVEKWQLELTPNDNSCANSQTTCAVAPAAIDPFAEVIFVPQ